MTVTTKNVFKLLNSVYVLYSLFCLHSLVRTGTRNEAWLFALWDTYPGSWFWRICKPGAALPNASHPSWFQVDVGASFIITQFFFQVDVFINFVQRCRRIGIRVPIIPGVMLIRVTESSMSYLGIQLFKRLHMLLSNMKVWQYRKSIWSRRIWGFHSHVNVDGGLLDCCAMRFWLFVKILRRNSASIFRFVTTSKLTTLKKNKYSFLLIL